MKGREQREMEKSGCPVILDASFSIGGESDFVSAMNGKKPSTILEKASVDAATSTLPDIG